MSRTSGLSDSTTVRDLEVAWEERAREAQVLMGQGHYTMAISLRIYSLEILLKTLICKTLKLKTLPYHCFTHDLGELMLFSGFSNELEEPEKSEIYENWLRLAKFSDKRLNDLRYLPTNHFTATELEVLTIALDDPTNGVIAWLSTHL